MTDGQLQVLKHESRRRYDLWRLNQTPTSFRCYMKVEQQVIEEKYQRLMERLAQIDARAKRRST